MLDEHIEGRMARTTRISQVGDAIESVDWEAVGQRFASGAAAFVDEHELQRRHQMIPSSLSGYKMGSMP